MRGFLLDTCAISEFARPSPDLGLVQWLSKIESSIVYISAVTIGELRYGIMLQANQKRRRALEQWLQSEVLVDFQDRVLPFDGDVAQRWGHLRGDLRKAGAMAPTLDVMIAATALYFSLSVVTRNVRDFESAQVGVINPWSYA